LKTLWQVCRSLPLRGGRSRVTGARELENPNFEAKNSSPNRAFAGPPNRLPDALKNTRKILFIQQLVDTDFALGAWRLSWHK
jgi:hypothetical protein